MILRLNLFWKELFLFTATILLGIFTSANYKFFAESATKPISFSWDSGAVFIILFLLMSFFLFKFKKIAAVSFKFFLLLVVFSGSQIIFEAFFGRPWDIMGALAVIAVFIFFRSVIVHDLGIILGIAGVASLLGTSINPTSAIILLVLLSFYDIVAVYWTKHMVYMARGMMESGAIFGFIIPFELGDFFHHKHEARQKIGEKFMVLGSGDIGLPVVMAGSVAVSSTGQALIVGFFSILGLFLTHLIFVNQTVRKPMAALPPIATSTIIGYLISTIIR